MTPHWVYLVHDARGELLYVGCSSSPWRRYTMHESTTPWWHLMVTTRELGPYPKREALDLETDLIWTLGPLCNKPMIGDYREFGLIAAEHTVGHKFTKADLREIRRRNLNNVPPERTALLMVGMREAMDKLGDLLCPAGWIEAAPTEKAS